MKVRPDHIAKVEDAIRILKSKGQPHYRPDIADFTGLSIHIVTKTMDHIESLAVAAPTGPKTIPWTLMKGAQGGIAITDAERHKAADQRYRSIQSTLERDERRNYTEYARTPLDEEKAVLWATAALRVGRTTFAVARDTINQEHLTALLGVKPRLDFAEVARLHNDLMREIDAL